MTVEDQIRANAALTIATLGPVSGIEGFGYNAASVKWLEGYIERQRNRGVLKGDGLAQIVSNLGSYLGECVIACFGGEWRLLDGMWCVAFDANNAVFPFNKISKQFRNGAEADGVYGWFTVIPAIMTAASSQGSDA
jgi:hypothetical protein